MDQEFITTRGKIILGKHRVLVQDLKTDFTKTFIGEVTMPIIVLTLIVLSFLDANKPFSYFGTAIYLLLFGFFYLKRLYIILIRKSYSNYIPVNRVKSFEIKPDEFGLETDVRLHLRNGRYRSVIFRTRESQYQPFTEGLSEYLAKAQFA